MPMYTAPLELRAWDTKEKEWKSQVNTLIDLTGQVFWQFGYDSPKSIEHFEISQSTGLKDKNDKMIFGGFIVKRDDGAVYVVEWDKDICAFNISDDGEYEILGNVFEDSHLIKDL